MPAEKTQFQQKADAHQKNQGRTKEQGAKDGLGALALGLIGLAIVAGIYLVIGKDSNKAWLLWVFMGIAALVAALGLFTTIVNLMRPTKAVVCPKCGVEHQIYKNVEKYMCTNCRSLLLIARDAQTQPRLLACPYCGLQTAVADDYGRFLCPNCGIFRQSDSQTPPSMTSPCPSCHEPVPENAIYCEACGRILISDFSRPMQVEPSLAYDRDWEIGKDAVGHFHFARALLQATRDATSEADSVNKIQATLSKLEKALISIEESLQEPALYANAEALIPEVDSTYAHLLVVESSLIAVEAVDPRGFKDSLSVLTNEPHVAARKRIEAILGDALTTSGGIGTWGNTLVEVQWDKEPEVWRITDFDRLLQERARFETWEAQLTKQ